LNIYEYKFNFGGSTSYAAPIALSYLNYLKTKENINIKEFLQDTRYRFGALIVAPKVYRQILSYPDE